MESSSHGSPRSKNVPKRGHINPRSPLTSWRSRCASSSGNPYAGYHFLRLAQCLYMSEKRSAPLKAMQYALKAIDCFEKIVSANVRPEIEMSLHLLAATKCRLGQYEESIAVLQKALAMYIPEMGSEQAFGAFVGHMQLEDTYAMLGQYENALTSYHEGLRIQKLSNVKTVPNLQNWRSVKQKKSKSVFEGSQVLEDCGQLSKCMQFLHENKERKGVDVRNTRFFKDSKILGREDGQHEICTIVTNGED